MTCPVVVEFQSGKCQNARALLDTGSSMSFVTQHLVNSLQAKKIPWVTRISGVQGTEVPSSKFVANLLLHSTVGNKTPL